ncbi:SURF1 family protein [soil metagenome]
MNRRLRRSLLVVLLGCTVAAVCVLLGFWQLDRLAQRRARNAAARSALALPPLVLDSAALAVVAAGNQAMVGRRVEVSGSYAPAAEVILRGRSRDGWPGVHLVTPLRVTGTRWTLWVDRGWVPAADGANPESPHPPPSGRVRLAGLLGTLSGAGGAEPLRPSADATVSVRRLDVADLAPRTPGALVPLVVERLGDTLGASPLPARLPDLGNGPHLGYAVQWFAFASIALGGSVLLARQRPR